MADGMVERGRESWGALGDACNDCADELVKLGLPVEQRAAAYQILWAIAAWQGDREFKRERIDFAEEASRLLYETARKPRA